MSEQQNNILLDIPPLSQRDPRWIDVQLGSSNTTIGGYGCLLTCISMMLGYFGITTADPIWLNAWLRKHAGFSNGNLFVWGSLTFDKRVQFIFRYDYPATEKIDEQLALGRPAIIKTDMVPETYVLDEHWVLVVGRVDGSYIINDPWTGDQVKFEKRYKKILSVSTFDFKGEIPSRKLPAQKSKTIKHNKAKCLKCGEVLESETVHDFKTCLCGNLSVDGGKEYLRRCFVTMEWEELSEAEEE